MIVFIKSSVEINMYRYSIHVKIVSEA